MVYVICVGLILLYQVPLKLLSLKSPPPGRVVILCIAVMTILGFVLAGPVSIPLGILLYVVIGVMNVFLRWY
jgi:hypothetical protein